MKFLAVGFRILILFGRSIDLGKNYEALVLTQVVKKGLCVWGASADDSRWHFWAWSKTVQNTGTHYYFIFQDIQQVQHNLNALVNTDSKIHGKQNRIYNQPQPTNTTQNTRRATGSIQKR